VYKVVPFVEWNVLLFDESIDILRLVGEERVRVIYVVGF
jgi:hypothetical protein